MEKEGHCPKGGGGGHMKLMKSVVASDKRGKEKVPTERKKDVTRWPHEKAEKEKKFDAYIRGKGVEKEINEVH